MLSPIAALESPFILAAQAVRRTARVSDMQAAPPVAEPPKPATVQAPAHAASPAPADLDKLRHQYADDRVRQAVQAHQRSAREQGACEGVAWGTYLCLQPTQAYRVALPNPPVEAFNLLVPEPMRNRAVPSVRNAGLDEGFENARQRRQFRSSP